MPAAQTKLEDFPGRVGRWPSVDRGRGGRNLRLGGRRSRFRHSFS